MVLQIKGDVLKRMGGCIIGKVKVNELAAVMIDVVSNGSKEQILQNAEIAARGKLLIEGAAAAGK